jgi:hypothetical protein
MDIRGAKVCQHLMEVGHDERGFVKTSFKVENSCFNI